MTYKIILRLLKQGIVLRYPDLIQTLSFAPSQLIKIKQNLNKVLFKLSYSPNASQQRRIVFILPLNTKFNLLKPRKSFVLLIRHFNMVVRHKGKFTYDLPIHILDKAYIIFRFYTNLLFYSQNLRLIKRTVDWFFQDASHRSIK